MPSIARAGLGGSQEPETPSTSAVWMAGTRVPEPASVVSWAASTGSWNESRVPGPGTST